MKKLISLAELIFRVKIDLIKKALIQCVFLNRAKIEWGAANCRFGAKIPNNPLISPKSKIENLNKKIIPIMTRIKINYFRLDLRDFYKFYFTNLMSNIKKVSPAFYAKSAKYDLRGISYREVSGSSPAIFKIFFIL